jgi:DNA replication protein DnaC
VDELRAEKEDEYFGNNAIGYYSCDILALDEIGVQYETQSERNVLFTLPNHRYENYKPAIIISNYPMELSNDGRDIPRLLGQRILDRLTDKNSSIFELKGESMRRGNK